MSNASKNKKLCDDSRRRKADKDDNMVIDLMLDGTPKTCGEICQILRMHHHVISGILSRLACRNVIHKNKNVFPFTYRLASARFLLELYFHDGGKTNATDLYRLRSEINHNENVRVHRGPYSLNRSASKPAGDGATGSSEGRGGRQDGTDHALGLSIAAT